MRKIKGYIVNKNLRQIGVVSVVGSVVKIDPKRYFCASCGQNIFRGGEKEYFFDNLTQKEELRYHLHCIPLDILKQFKNMKIIELLEK